MQGGKFRGRSGPSQCAGAILMVRPKHFGYNAQTAGDQSLSAARRPEGRCGRRVAAGAARIRRVRRGAVRRGRARVRGGGFGHAAQARRGVPEQLGELPRRRHCGAVSDACRESPRRAAPGNHRRGRARDRIRGAARARSDRARESRPLSRRHRQPGAGSSSRAWPMPAARRAPTRRGARMGARDGLRARVVLGHRRVGHAHLPHQRASCTWERASRSWRWMRSRAADRERVSDAPARGRPRSDCHRSRGNARLRRQHAGSGQLGRIPRRFHHPRDVGDRAPRAGHAQVQDASYASVDAVLAVPIECIERHGGGSVRCMLAEIFLP